MARKKISEGEKASYTVATPIVLDETRYEAGETIELTAEEAAEIGAEVRKS
jgi:hypothetical protein